MGKKSRHKAERRKRIADHRQHVQKTIMKGAPAVARHAVVNSLLTGVNSAVAKKVAVIDGEEIPLKQLDDESLAAFHELLKARNASECAGLDNLANSEEYAKPEWTQLFLRCKGALKRYLDVVQAEMLERGLVVKL